MLIEIKNRYTGAVMHAGEHASLRECVESLVAGRASLTDADLTRANLTGAYLTDANLTRAQFVIELPANDSRGYRLLASHFGGEWRLWSGCCGPFTVAQAREHWGAASYESRERGDRYLRAIYWFELELPHLPAPEKREDATDD